MAFARIVTHYFHHHAWPAAELHLVATGHAGGEEMTARTWRRPTGSRGWTPRLS
jgi:hypothetical protein